MFWLAFSLALLQTGYWNALFAFQCILPALADLLLKEKYRRFVLFLPAVLPAFDDPLVLNNLFSPTLHFELTKSLRVFEVKNSYRAISYLLGLRVLYVFLSLLLFPLAAVLPLV